MAATATLSPVANAAARAGATGRAIAAARYACEWRSLGALGAVAASWQELAARAIEPNVFYEPAFASAAAAVFGRTAGAVLVWSQDRRLVGLFPGRIEKRRYGVRLPVLVGWSHPYAPLGTPLIDRDAADGVIAAWLRFVAECPDLPSLLLLPLIAADGPVQTLIAAAAASGAIEAVSLNLRRRAMLMPRGDRALYVEQSLGQHQHKELRRHFRRLAESGAVLFTTATSPEAVAAAAGNFLALEAQGWKGRAGTAAAGNEDLHRFFCAALEGLAAHGGVAIDRLLVDGTAIAATILLRSGDRAWFWKTAYDESFALFSPGVMLAVVLTDELVEDQTLTATDSCANGRHPMIDHIWREQLVLNDCLIATRPGASFAVARQLEIMRVAAIRQARKFRDRMWR
jgi:CelD/BcsL family acetyltransferase involved in cellulose biosynthesis